MTTTNHNKSNFSSRLRELRGGRSQSEFATSIGIQSQQTYANYEKGRVPKLKIAQEIAQRAGVKLEWLLGENVEKYNATECVTLKDDTPVYGGKLPPLANSGIYAGILESLLPGLGVSELMDLAEVLHRDQPPGWEPLASQAIAILRQKIANIENHGQKT